MSKAKALVSGASWLLGAQLLIVFIQFGYASITARLLDPQIFGTYAVALSASALFSLLSNGGLAQAIIRTNELEDRHSQALFIYALGLGLCFAALQLIFADLWSHLWGVPEAATSVRLLSTTTLLAPVIALETGYLRRQGKFRPLAHIMWVTNIIGMAVGVVAVYFVRDASSLTVSVIVAQILTTIAGFLISSSAFRGFASIKLVKPYISYSWKLTLVNLFAYGNGNILRWGVSRFAGVSALGLWNRADVITTVPFEYLQNALMQVLYPQFRHREDEKAKVKEVWTDLLILAAWIIIPLAALASLILPHLVLLLFGPKWQDAVSLVGILCFTSGVGVLTTLLGSAIESMGKFRWVWLLQITAVSIQIVVLITVIASRALLPALIGVIAVNLATHIVQLLLLTRSGYLDLRLISRNYVGVVILTAVILGSGYLVVISTSWTKPEEFFLTFLGISLLLSILAICWRFKDKFPPIAIARKYKLFK